MYETGLRYVLYHGDADGKCSAAIAGMDAKRKQMEVEYMAVHYGDKPPWDRIAELMDRYHPGSFELWVVDFSFDLETMKKLMSMVGRSHFYWFDHHKTALEKLESLDDMLPGIRVDGKAACELVWAWCSNGGDPAPLAVQYIGDRDVWKFAHGDSTKYFYEAFLQEDSYPHDEVFWDWLFKLQAVELNRYLALGRSLRVARIRMLEKMAGRLGREIDIEIDGQSYRALKVNFPGSGDMAQVIKDLGYAVALTYFERPGEKGDALVREHSAYSDVADVSILAAQNGGGGHVAAAGWIEEVAASNSKAQKAEA